MLMRVGEGNTSFDGARRSVADASPAGPVQSLSGITSSLKLFALFPRPPPPPGTGGRGVGGSSGVTLCVLGQVSLSGGLS